MCAEQSGTNLAEIIKNVLQNRGYIMFAPHCLALDASVVHLVAVRNMNGSIHVSLFHILQKTKLRNYIIEKEIVRKLKAIKKQTNYDIYFIIYVKEIEDTNKNFFVYPLEWLERSHSGNYLITEYRLETATSLAHFS